ncbi:MAG: hypothetical protein E6K03_08940 [Methanobacteriota archaeon]|nr:MAG: hypothetical protein E6K03_08940 [Euryarchaeota archaeon]
MSAKPEVAKPRGTRSSSCESDKGLPRHRGIDSRRGGPSRMPAGPRGPRRTRPRQPRGAPPRTTPRRADLEVAQADAIRSMRHTLREFGPSRGSQSAQPDIDARSHALPAEPSPRL